MFTIVPMFPHSPVINITQNVNIFVKTKNAQEALKHKINLKIFFVTWAFPYWGGGLTTWEKFPRKVVFLWSVSLMQNRLPITSDAYIKTTQFQVKA